MRITALLVAAAVLATGTIAHAGRKPEDSEIVLNIGHRGASGHAPEHTIPAYDLALKMGADVIEQDLQMTSDGVLVVLHDGTLDRTARGPAENCTGAVITKTLAQIKTCDVGSWFNDANPGLARAEFVGQRIPTLDEVFERYGKKASYHIETKSPEQAPGMEEELLRLLDEHKLRDRAATRWQVLIQSFSPASLIKIHQLDPELPLIQLVSGGGSQAIRAMLDGIAMYAVGIGPSHGNVDAALVEASHLRCLDLHPYTVNDPARMQQLLDLGVDGMFTNYPDRLDEILAQDAVKKDATALAARASSACRQG
ncbi:MAG TPA: glycerophosphodiester phosphodiesterase [Actinomycetota bacterium]|jgi:glycerophosphoryl diester phosphodiesterase